MQALIDLDILKYEIGFSGEYEETDNATGETIHHIRDFDFVQELLDNKIKFICDEVGATEAPILFMTADSFTAKLLGKELIDPIRNSIATVKPYKGTRKGEKPFHFNNIVAYCLANYDCRVAFGLEADDLMALEQINNAKEYGCKIQTHAGDVLVDYEDWLKYHNTTFIKDNKGYFINDTGKGSTRNVWALHRDIMGEPDGIVDHVNGETADNRKYNLRVCTVKENVRNSKAQEGTSDYKGVSWDSNRGKWVANITADGVRKFLGRFEEELDAAIAYDKAAKKFFGEFARLNLEKPYIKPFKETVICSRDKDLKMVPLNHYSWECGKQPSFGPELVDAKGWIKLSADNKTIKGVGLKFFFAQMLIGDTVDNIPGCPKVGPVKAFKLLEECNTKREHEKAVIAAYENYYGDEYKERLEEQSKLLWMVRELNPDGSPKHYEWKFND